MKKYTQRKRATAHSRAAKRYQPTPLKNPKPHIPAPMAPHIPTYSPPLPPSPALDWDTEEMAAVEKPSGCAYYFLGAIAVAIGLLVWWLY